MGLKKGDKILALNGKSVDSYNEFTDEISRINDQLAARQRALPTACAFAR